tara:strand:+ start:523 stop:693 length:171 start_codon:yes stop_codon:yes gene_type:complete
LIAGRFNPPSLGHVAILLRKSSLLLFVILAVITFFTVLFRLVALIINRVVEIVIVI